MQKILFQGDSITDCHREYQPEQPHQDLALSAGYVMLVGSQLLAEFPKKNLEIVNRGISGHRIVDLYARWRIDCLNLQPDIISILIGINDVGHRFFCDNGVDTPRFYRIYQELLQWTRDELPRSRIILGEPFILPGTKVDYESWLPEVREKQQVTQQLAAEQGIAFIPYQKVFDQAAQEAKPSYWLYDGIHPTIAGYYLMAKSWLQAAQEAQIF